MNANEQAVWLAAFGAAFATAHARDDEGFATIKGCRTYAGMVAYDAVQAYRAMSEAEKNA